MKQPQNHVFLVSAVGLLLLGITALFTAAQDATTLKVPEPETPSPEEPQNAPAPRKPVKVERARIVPPGSPPAAPSPPLKPFKADVESPGAEGSPGHHAVREVRLVMEGGGRVDGARQDDWIAFDMMSETDERYDIYSMRLGQGVEKCLTCEQYIFRKVNVLNPAWHPSGDYLVVQVQENAKKRKIDTLRLATPHRALGSELWVITADGRDAWQLTRTSERGGAVLDPHFSHEADLLLWSERLTSREPPWGEWGLRVVDFKIRRGQPHLGKTRTYRSGIGEGLLIAHGFTPDDGGILLSAIPDQGLPEPDILRFDLETERSERVTSSPDQSDEMVSSVPYSDYLVWVSDRGLGDPRRLSGLRGPLPRRNEVWLRSRSGRLQERLTYFNHPRSDHSLGAAMIGDLSWASDGESLLLQVLSVPPGSTEVKEAIFLLKLGDEYRR